MGWMGSSVRDLWGTGDERQWREALEHYWDLVRPELLALEREMADLTPAAVAAMTAEDWVAFLREKYFRWKYTAPNRYATTTHALARQVEGEGIERLDEIRRRILDSGTQHLGDRLRAALEIKGLGAAGASGLVALLYPESFGTVDQFVVKALRQIEDLPEREVLLAMEPEALCVSDAVLLILILQRKAKELNEAFGMSEWTPRKVEMVLWAVGRA